MDKRGLSNIEFVISFVLFVSFVVFALYVFNPIKSARAIDSTISYSTDEIITNTSVELVSYSVKVNPSAFGDSVIAVSIPSIDSKKNERVEDYYGKQLPSARSGDLVYVKKGSVNFFEIMFSEDVLPGTLNEQAPLDSTKYTIASSWKGKLISEKKMLEMNNSYYKDYSGLKKGLGIPAGTEFAWDLSFQDSYSITAKRFAPAKIEVMAETKRVEVLRKDGSSEFAYLMVKIW